MVMYTETTTVNRCRPGFNASCALCCGSHNYLLSPDQLEEMFLDRTRGCFQPEIKHPEVSNAEKLFHEEIQCPNIGMRSSEPGMIGCLAYDDENFQTNEAGVFFKGMCKSFYCPAWYDLTDRQILFAAQLMGDWYNYSLFINDTESVREICAEYRHPEEVPAEFLEMVKEELKERFLEEDGK